MPDNSQSELSYQPAVKGYSFSANPVTPAEPEKQTKPERSGDPKSEAVGKILSEAKSSPAGLNKKTNPFILLFVEILGLLFVFAVFLLTLNYFKIISLPGPTLDNFSALNNSQASQLAKYTKLTNQAQDTQMKKYQSNATIFTKPQASLSRYVSDAIFSGYDNKAIQVVTSEGTLNLNFDNNTLFQKQPTPPKTDIGTPAGGILPVTIKYTTFQDFLKDAVFGSYLQVTYTKPNLKAIQVNYIESITPLQ